MPWSSRFGRPLGRVCGSSGTRSQRPDRAAAATRWGRRGPRPPETRARVSAAGLAQEPARAPVPMGTRGGNGAAWCSGPQWSGAEQAAQAPRAAAATRRGSRCGRESVRRGTAARAGAVRTATEQGVSEVWEGAEGRSPRCGHLWAFVRLDAQGRCRLPCVSHASVKGSQPNTSTVRRGARGRGEQQGA